MPRSALLANQWRALCAALAIVLILCTGFQTNAQQRRRRSKPATQTPTQTDSNSNSATATPTPQKPQKKNLAALRGSDSPQGGRATITSDAPLNDYEAYRSGNRYYVVIPQANAPGAPGGLRGRGYDDVQVHKRGNDTVLSFRLKPGTTAHVNQKFNRLEVVFNTPGDPATGSPSGTAGSQTANSNKNAQGTGSTPSGTTAATSPSPNTNTAASGTTSSTTSTRAGVVPPTTTGSPGTALLPSITPAIEPTVESSTAVASPTPPADQVAQSQPAPPIVPTAVTTTPAASSGTSLGTVLKNNWLLVLIAALLLISVGLVAMTRSRSGRSATETRPIDDKETPALEEGAIVKSNAERLEEASVAGAVAAVVQTAERPAAIEPATMLDETETLEVEPVESVNIERVRLEIKHILTGKEYDESVINAPVKETRQLIESELLFALSKRNTDRRERALKAFTRHGYFDDATRDLRTADVRAERAAAARKLGLTRDPSATPHLVAALEDSAPEVRRAAVEALAELGDPAAVVPLKSLLERKEDRKVPHALVQRAIKVSAAGTIGQKETPAAVVQSAPAEEALALEPLPAVDDDAAPPIAEKEASSPIAEAANLAAEAGTPSVIAASLVSAPVSPTSADEEIQAQRTEAEREIVAEPSTLHDVDIAPPAVEATTDASSPAPTAVIESAVITGAVTAAAASAAERHRAKADAARLHAEQERLRVEEEARRREEAERQREEEERQRAAEARRREEEAEHQRIEAEAQRQRDEAEAERRRAEEEKARVEEEARRHAEEEKKRLEMEERLKAAEEERLRAEEARRQRAEERERRRAEEEKARLEVQERERTEADAARRRAEEAALRLAEMRRRAEEEVRHRAEAEAARLLHEEEARRAQEEAERERVEREEAAARQREEEEIERQRAAEARRKEEEAERQREEEERQRAAEARRREEEAEHQRIEAEAQRQRDEAEAERRRAEEEKARVEEEARRHAEEERRHAAEEERQRAEAEAAERRRREEAEAAAYAKIDEIEPGSTEDAVTPAMQPELFESTLAAEPPSFGSSHEASAEIVERNASDWVSVDFNEPEVLPVTQSPVSAASAAVFDDAAITEYEGAEAGALPVTEIEESPAESEVKEIELASVGRGSAFADDDFASVPGGIMRRLSSEVASERAGAVTDLARIGGDDAFREISAAFDDPAQLVRDAAARALFDLHDDHASSFTRALREAPADRRRRIGQALASSGLANEAIGHLMGESREKTYDAFSLLFLMSKAGEVQPLMRSIEEHPNSEVRLAVVKLLALSGQQDILPAFRRLAVRGSLPTEVRSAVMEAIYQISSQPSSDTTHVA